MRNAAESVNAYRALFLRRGNSALSHRPQAADSVSAADLQLIDSFSDLSKADRAAALRQTGAMLREKMQALSGKE